MTIEMLLTAFGFESVQPSNGSDNTTGRGVSKEDEANECLQPLMDHFESILSILANVCDKTVLKRILKVCIVIYKKNLLKVKIKFLRKFSEFEEMLEKHFYPTKV
ncbi:unnamed protein product [Schistosoma mattheei]|uniref:Uncharacterized protein n=1 Tax=Schistosoma mattheei TaxID=31246 RepID=A0A183NR89_9TREM|nr:unnamed protein product [Schistosoma mattheei]